MSNYPAKHRERLRANADLNFIDKLRIRPQGRPRGKYCEGYAELVFKLRCLGLAVARIAWVMQATPAELSRWRAEIPSFADAWRQGGELADATVARALYHRAIGYSHEDTRMFYNPRTDELVRATYMKHYPPDTNAAMIWLANRQPALWKTTNRIANEEGAGHPPPSIIVEMVTASAGDARTPLVIEHAAAGESAD